MYDKKGFSTYKQYWEDQASFIDKSPWNKQKILKLSFSNEFENQIQELKPSNHSLSREGGQLTLRLKVPYNYFEIDNFELIAIDLLGLKKNWLTNLELVSSLCTNSSIK